MVRLIRRIEFAVPTFGTAEAPRFSRGVSKDGRESMRCGHPSRRIGSADAPQDEVQEHADMIQTSETQY